MKKTLFILCFMMFCFVLNAETPYYFYNYEGKKVYLSLNTEYIFLSSKEPSLPIDIVQHKFDYKEFQSDRKQYSESVLNRFWTELSLGSKISDEQYLALLSEMKHQSKDIIVSPFFKMGNSNKIGLSNFFYVKLKAEQDLELLKEMSRKIGSIIIEQDAFMPLWFVLSVTEQSEYNALESANIFYESGLFATTTPDLMVDLAYCVNDTHFSQQWGLKNTGQNGGTIGVDIKSCNAWQLTTGQNIVVAVIDNGIELNHPDLTTNIYPLSFDSETGASPQTNIYGDHGVACAGIIGATRNNGIGVAGVAPNSKLMSISNSLTLKPNILQYLTAAINWAWQNGADVISNSWGSDMLQDPYITSAINDALTYGRNGKGCVVVFASGNDNASTVSYPASLPNVIAVGAIDRCGVRSGRIDIIPNSCDPWCATCYPGSSYGTALSVVAPGTNVYTTDRQGSAGYNTASGTAGDYYSGFGGTSAACPHVAGIAALILSVNPNLTVQQVRDIIETTARSLSAYPRTQIRLNGLWNNEVGYGLVDAYEAVIAAQATILSISGPDHVCSSATYTFNKGTAASWSVTPSNIFTLTSTGNSATVTTSNFAAISGTLTVATSGGSIFTRSIKSCSASISGTNFLCPNTIPPILLPLHLPI